MNITHTKVSAKTDSADTTLVRPSDWNADHVAEFGYVSVIDYGAVGNGTTDDSTAFAAAIATGDNVFVPGGLTYVVLNLVMTTDGQVIFGGGTLKIKATAAPGDWIVSMSGDFQRVEGLVFDCLDRLDQTWGVVIATGTVHNVVTANRFINTSAGVSIHGTAADIVITGNTFYGLYGVLTRSDSTPQRINISYNVFNGSSAGDAIEIDTPTGNAKDVVCLGNLISGYTGTVTGGFGIAFAHVTGGVISGNLITDCNNDGVHIEDGSSDIIVSGNRIARITGGAQGSGVAVLSSGARDSYGIVIDGNHISDCEQHGITLAASDPIRECVVSNNVIRGCGTAGDADAGIQVGYLSTNTRVIGNVVSNTVGVLPGGCGILVSFATDVLVQGNRCFDDQGSPTQLYGLAWQGTQTDVQVINNDFTGNATAPIYDDAGSKTRVRVHSNLGVTPAAVTGSRGGNAALASALTTLATMGLITDSSS